MNSRRLHELIDSCRPGHADLDQPEFRELAQELSQDPSLQRLFERSQELDEGIRTAFQAVTPPPGLAQRLLEAVENPIIEAPIIEAPIIEAPIIEAPIIEAGEDSPEVAEAEPRVELARHPSRRSLGVWAGVASLAAVAAVSLLWIQWPQPISLPSSDRDIAELVDRWNAELAESDETSWQTTADIPAEDFPTWQHLDLSIVARWQWMMERRIACYDFAVKGGTVRLFVIKPAAPVALPTSPPLLGYPLPNGWQVGAWQANGRVYYLAVYADGDSKGLYERVIASPYNAA